MAKQMGRKITISRGGSPAEPIANVRTKTVSINREPVDATDDDSNGWRELLGEPGQSELNMTVEGVFASDTILSEALDTSSGLVAHTLEFDDGATIEGDFFLATFELTGEYNGVATYSFELQSSGEVTYTAAA